MLRKLISLTFMALLAVNTFVLHAQGMIVEKEQSFSGVKALKVKGDFCAVLMNAAENTELGFKGTVKSEKATEGYDMKVSESAGVVSIEVIKPAAWSSHWGEIILSIPQGIAIEAESLSGKIELNGVSGSDIMITSKSGHIVLNDVEGSIIANSPAGSVTLTEGKGDFKLKSKNGAVSVTKLNGNTNISSDKGAISVTETNGNVIVYGGEGLQTYENINGEMSVKSTSGNMKISLCNGKVKTRTFGANQNLFQCEGIFEVQSSKGNVIGKRIGFSGSSSFECTEGSVKIQTTTKSGVRYELSSDGSMLRALDKSKKKSLKIGKGDVIITGVTTTGAQSFY